MNSAHELLSNIDKVESGFGECWIWKRATHNKGKYGCAWWEGKSITAHRASYLCFVNSYLTEDYEVHHKCPNKLCINPGHLEALTKEEHRSLEPRNKHKNFCKRGHEMTIENTRLFNNKGYTSRHCIKCVSIRSKKSYLKRKTTQTNLTNLTNS